jgi:V/A-type H+-transporting ATPase subunit K
MEIMEFVLLAVPVVFLVGSILLAYKAVKSGAKRKTAVFTQIASFCIVGLVCLIIPMTVSAADTAAVVDSTANGLGMLAAALATGISGIGGGIAVAGAAPAAIGATSEDPKAFGKSLIFVALGEGVALYGLLVSILILNKF